MKKRIMTVFAVLSVSTLVVAGNKNKGRTFKYPQVPFTKFYRIVDQHCENRKAKHGGDFPPSPARDRKR